MAALTATAPPPEFLPYTKAMDELFVHLEAHKLPKIVHALLGATLQNPINLMCLVGNAELAAGTPRVEAGLYASDLLMKLLVAVRALDWELIANVLAHAVSLSSSDDGESEVTPEMVKAGTTELPGVNFGDFDEKYVTQMITAAYRAMRRLDARPSTAIPEEHF